ncbi:MAG: gliding motility-associated protein GldE [Bacteroidales bacterium]|nr:gliding motility-associated protein GldE [Bacteroidales bacterium]MBK7626466.1 gliding motility-associated protein GldE [Bacteroidales bacterium]
MLLFASGLMSASEVAYFSFRPEDIERFKSNKNKQSKSALKLYNKPERLLSTILVANNTVNIAIVLLAAFISSRMFDFSSEPVIGFIVNVIVITFLLLFFGEVMPKVYASKNHIAVALFMAYPLTFLQKLFLPITSLLILSSSFVRKRTGNRHSNISMDDLSDALELTSDENNEDDKILKGIVNFGNINVSAIMCPRMDVTSIDIRSGFDKIVPVIISSGFSRIPVYSGSFDTVKGILYAKDVLPYVNNPSGFKWQALLRPPYFVPETKKINELLKEFQTRKIHMAVVIDEYGGTSGIVTLEDILEEIVGEITDESDQDELLYRKIDDKTYIFEGKILLNDFCKVFEIEEEIFEEVRGESETLAGLILELTGEIPQKDQVIKHNGFIFRIESADRRRIKEIRVEIVKNDEEKNQE